MAARKEFHFDCQDGSLWLLLMCPYRPSSFQTPAAPSALTEALTALKKGVCWLFNESHCKLYTVCCFKHECLLFGGAELASRCFRKSKQPLSKPGSKPNLSKPEDAGEHLRDASLDRLVPPSYKSFDLEGRFGPWFLNPLHFFRQAYHCI